MERIQALIDKLYQQKQQGNSPADLLLTVQLLQSELVTYHQKNGNAGSRKVAVSLPSNWRIKEEAAPVAITEAAPVAFKEAVPIPKAETVPEVLKIAETKPNQPEISKYNYTEVVNHQDSPYMPSAKVNEPAPAWKETFDMVAETPTLTQHQNVRELHEVIAVQNVSLNDRLKQDKTELAHRLKDTPIKDLKKGIGINDRFTFISELFRGDEAMYERSIKTINGFQVLAEAEYWINRELKVKLGWNDTLDLVQHFYQLVRRRFS